MLEGYERERATTGATCAGLVEVSGVPDSLMKPRPERLTSFRSRTFWPVHGLRLSYSVPRLLVLGGVVGGSQRLGDRLVHVL
jgi:hypothetical protein